MLFYTPHIAPRIIYILQYFNERLLIDAELIDDLEHYRSSTDFKLNYSNERIDPAEFFIQPAGLLQQNEIQKQFINCFDWKEGKAFFKTDDDLGFDLFSAVFYLLTRYEEYLEYEPDEYGRFAHWNSLAWKEKFLQIPLIDIWLLKFKRELELKFNQVKLKTEIFKFIPTYDIDIAWSYKNKGIIRNLAASIIRPLTIPDRFKVLFGKKQDPFDCYDWLQQFHQTNELHPIYFFLVAHKNEGLDKNILPKKKALQQLIKTTAGFSTVALHPSTQSNTNKNLFLKEKNLLEKVSAKPVTNSRYHYLLFYVPHSYRELITAGFTDDYSMGYATVNGFRVSTSHSFLWYDLEKEETTSLRIHPFAIMDANNFYEQHHSPEQALAEMNFLLDEVKKVNGTMITVFHNHFLGTDKLFKGWRRIYEEFITALNS